MIKGDVLNREAEGFDLDDPEQAAQLAAITAIAKVFQATPTTDQVANQKKLTDGKKA